MMVSCGPKLDVDPNSGQRAQLSMRLPTLLALALAAACSGLKAPETIPAAPGEIPPAAGAAPAPGAPTRPTASRRPLIGPAWPLAQRAKPVSGAHAMVVSS